MDIITLKFNYPWGIWSMDDRVSPTSPIHHILQLWGPFWWTDKQILIPKKFIKKRVWVVFALLPCVWHVRGRGFSWVFWRI